MEKQLSITYSEYMSVALVIQHEKVIPPLILRPLASPILRNFSTLSQKRHDFWEKVIEQEMFDLIVSTAFV